MADPKILHTIGRHKISNRIEERRDLAERYGAGRAFVLRGDLMPPSGTLKDLRNAALLKKFSHLTPLVIPQITSGNSGRSLELLAREMDPRGERIKLVNISSEEMNEKIKNAQGEESTYPMDLGNGRIYMTFMRELARQHLKMPGLPDRHIIGVEHPNLPYGYSSIVGDLHAQFEKEGLLPTHISCPLGAGELLAEIGLSAMELYGESCPMLLGNTVSRNPFAGRRSSSEDALFACTLADKLTTDVSNYMLQIDKLITEGILRVNTLLSGEQLKQEYLDINALGISAEPSAVTAFEGVNGFEFTKSDILVIICSGKGNFDPSVLDREVPPRELGVGTDTILEYSAVVEKNPEKASSIRGRELLKAVENSDSRAFNVLMAMRKSNPESVSLEELNERGVSALGVAMERLEFDMAIRMFNAGFRMLENDASAVNSLLHEFVKNDSVNGIKAAIMLGADSSFRNNEGGNALITAIKKQNKDVAEMLLPNYKKLDFCDSEGKTAVVHSIENGNLDFAKKLSDRGAGYLVKNDCGKPSFDCIKLAAEKNHLNFLDYLVDKNLDRMELFDSCGDTLYKVSMAGNLEAAKILLRAMDVLAKRSDYESIQFFGRRTYRGWPISESEIGHYPLAEKMSFIAEAIDAAVKMGHTGLVEFFLKEALDTYGEIKKGAGHSDKSIYSINDFLNLPNRMASCIGMAVKMDRGELFKKLLDLENESVGNSETIQRAFIEVSAKRNLEMLDLLIERGADLSYKEQLSCAFDCLYFGKNAVEVWGIMKKKGYALGREDRIYNNWANDWDSEYERNFYSWICSSTSKEEKKLKAKIVEKLLSGAIEVNPQVANFLFYLVNNPYKYAFKEYGGRAKLFGLIVEKLNWEQINSREEWTFWKGKLAQALVNFRRGKKENAAMLLLLVQNFENKKEKDGALYLLAAARGWIE